MSIKNSSAKIGAIAIIGITVGVTGSAFLKRSNDRAPSSISAQAQAWTPNGLGKHLAPIHVELLKPNIIPDSGDGEVTLVGHIILTQKLDGDLTYHWVLPDGVNVVDGQVEDTLAAVTPGQTVEVKITVSGFNKERQQTVALQGSGNLGDQHFGNSSVIVSRPEDTLESVAKALKKSADEQLLPPATK
jgi:hypothetical protein